MNDQAEHWRAVYEKRPATEVSWFQREATTSLALVAACELQTSAAILDIGAGASTFADGLIERGFTDLTLLDLAAAALADTRRRLPSAPIQYIAADITKWSPPRTFDLWHDRAVFHFLTDTDDRGAYRAALAKAIHPGAHVIVGTFALDGPERCSGLPVQRYSSSSLAREFDGLLRPVESRAERHRTPSGAEQSFVFVRFVPA